MALLDLLVRNGRVFTSEENEPWAEAVGAIGDRIAFVGPERDSERLVGPQTKVVDAGGRLVLPGFIDAHVHCLSAYQVYFWVDLTPANSVHELLEAVRKQAREHPEHRLVGGHGFRYSAVMVDGKLPGRALLDEAVPTRPVWLISYDGWTACTNSRFVELAQERLGEAFDEMPGVESDLRTGEPTGVFYKTELLEPMAEEVFTSGTDMAHQGLKLVLEDMARNGVTGIHDVGARSLKDIAAYEHLRASGDLKARVYVAMQYSKTRGVDQVVDFERARETYSDEWIKAGAVKLFIDGVADSHTAAMLEPYSDQPGVLGETIHRPEEFQQIVEELDRRGFQCITHACGDRGVRTALDAYEHAAASNGPRARRHRVEHVEMVSPGDICRFGGLGAIPSMQPLHAHLSAPPFDEAYGVAVGEARVETSFPWRGMLESRARLAFSSDWPVADMSPFLGIHAAVTRGGLPGRHNTITVEDAVRAYTIGSAYASFEEEMKGSLKAGKLADIIVVSRDLLGIPVDEVKDVKCLLTIVGGRVVYRSDELVVTEGHR